MRILQICNKPPFPPIDGGCLAMHSITEGLTEKNINVTVLAIHTPKHNCDIKHLPQDYIRQTSFQTAFINTNINLFRALVNLFQASAYNISRFYSKEFEDLIISVLQKDKFDIIQLESLYVAPYIEAIKKYTRAKIVLRAHNIENTLWERRKKKEKIFLKKIYFNILTSRIEKYELAVANKVDAIVTITEQDQKYFLQKSPETPSVVIPFGINIKKYEAPSVKKVSPDVFFIGALDWEPNLQGLLWFIENVWTKVTIKFPGINLFIAGKNTPEQIKKLASKSIKIKGEVPDAIDFMNEHTIMVVPLFSGGGMRIKIIEGMALGKTIITTSIGAEGISYCNGENILIADTVDEFTSSIERCINDPGFSKKTGNNAREFVLNNYDNEKFIEKLLIFYNAILTNKQA